MTKRIVSRLALFLAVAAVALPVWNKQTLDDCLPPPREEGNAADDYIVLLRDLPLADLIANATEDLASVARSRQGLAEYNLDQPLLDKIVEGSRKKECYFYPQYLPYPEIGKIDEMQSLDLQLAVDSGFALAMRGQRAYMSGDIDSASRDINAAYWFGRHLKEEYVSLPQSITGMAIMYQACRSYFGMAAKGDKVDPNFYARSFIVRDHRAEIKTDFRQRHPWPHIENGGRALKVLREGPPWYLSEVIPMGGSFARLLTIEIPEDDLLMNSLAETYSFFLVNWGGKQGIIGNTGVYGSYKENAEEIIAALEEIQKNPPSPFIGELARQVLVGRHEDLIGMAALLKHGKLSNGPPPAPAE